MEKTEEIPLGKAIICQCDSPGHGMQLPGNAPSSALIPPPQAPVLPFDVTVPWR